MKYPVTSFVHIDDIPDTPESVCESNCGENPIANSTMREPSQCSVVASVLRHDDQAPKRCCHGSSRSNPACEGCQSHSMSQCLESRDCQSQCESLPRSCVPTKNQCKSKCKSQCSSAATPRGYDLTRCSPGTCLDLSPCTPPVQTQCGSTSTARGNQSHCSSRNLPTSAPHSSSKRTITQCSNLPIIEPTSCQMPRECPDECFSYDVGHASHIPRTPPCPSTFDIPCISPKDVATGTCTDYHRCGDIFGMVKLGENDVCYTSGTIEWVSRKRTYPINTGFKLIKETNVTCSDVKKLKTLDQTFTCDVDKIKGCDCADVLPTMNAIVDHLNALHEAVDIVDLRLNTLENVMTKNN